MEKPLRDICDEYILKCQKVLDTKNVSAARKLRAEATARFYRVIPRWSSGLMASITNFYLDDIENIQAKLIACRDQLDQPGGESAAASPEGGDFLPGERRAIGILRPVSFEQTYHWILDHYSPGANETVEILGKFKELQVLADQPASTGEKWEKLKSLLSWINSKNSDLAAELLPLVAEIMQK